MTAVVSHVRETEDSLIADLAVGTRRSNQTGPAAQDRIANTISCRIEEELGSGAIPAKLLSVRTACGSGRLIYHFSNSEVNHPLPQVVLTGIMNLSDIKIYLITRRQMARQWRLRKAADEHLRRDVNISHQSIFGTLTHMAGAEWIWLERWHGRSPAKAEAWSR